MLNILGQLLTTTNTNKSPPGCREMFRPDDQNFIPGVFCLDVFITELKYIHIPLQFPVVCWAAVGEWHKKIKFITL